VTRSKWLPLSTILLAAALVLALPAFAEDPTTKSLEEHLKAVRGDIMERRESALRTLIRLDESQAKTFWTLRDQYDAELKKIGEARGALLREYAKVYKNPTPEQAKDIAFRSLKLDDDRNTLRRKYFELMTEKVSVIAASQFLQLERQFETMMDVKVQAVVPLAGD
jgi:uncharacterized protein with HEPN domain